MTAEQVQCAVCGTLHDKYQGHVCKQSVPTPASRPTGETPPIQQQFEAWMEKFHPKWHSAKQAGGNGYYLSSVQTIWEAFQAGAASREQELRAELAACEVRAETAEREREALWERFEDISVVLGRLTDASTIADRYKRDIAKILDGGWVESDEANTLSGQTDVSSPEPSAPAK